MNHDQRIALVLEADDKASASIARVRSEIVATQSAAGGVAGAVRGANEGLTQLGAGSESRSQRIGLEISNVARAIDTARLGSREAVRSVAELAANAATVTPALAAWAGPIAGAAAVLGTVLAIMLDTTREAERQKAFTDRLSTLTPDGLANRYAGVKAERAKAMAEYQNDTMTAWQGIKNFMSADLTKESGRAVVRSLGQKSRAEAERANAEYAAVYQLLLKATREEQVRGTALGDQSREMIRQKALAAESAEVKGQLARMEITTLASIQADARIQLETQNAATAATFRRRDAAGQLIALSAGEVRDRAQMISLNERAYRITVETARVKEVEREKDARFAVNTELAQVRLEAQGVTAFQAREKEAQIALVRSKIANERAGYSAELRAFLDSAAEQIFAAKSTLIAAEQAVLNRRAGAEQLTGSRVASEALRGRLEMIAIERDAQIKSGIDVRLATLGAERAKRQAYYETYRAAVQSAQQLSSVLIQSKSKELRAIGQSIAGVRRIVLGFEAAEATIQALKYGAKAIGYAADLQWARAGMAAAAAVQFAGVAAAAGAEAAGGGGGVSSAGGAGGGAAGSASTFEPRSASQGQGGVTIVLVTRDPYGREQIQQTMYALNRSGKLGVPPVQVPPTSGFTRVA